MCLIVKSKLAVQCRHPADRYITPVANRTRDADLSAYDRVSILLDLDRDYQTYFHLQVDQRGAVADDCWGDKSWNPRWFVAIHREPTVWTAEIAIPRNALTSDHITAARRLSSSSSTRVNQARSSAPVNPTAAAAENDA